MKQVAVVIPIYKEKPEELEEKSFIQCVKVLKKHPIIVIAPKGLNLDYYHQIYKDLQVKYFDKKFFENIWGYNKLLLSRFFYKTFSSYKYILIYQLDAYVFRDELLYWCSKGYDYIGAPWLSIQPDKFSPELEKMVGNGGFSLRKIEGTLRVLSSFAMIYPFNKLFQQHIKVENIFQRVRLQTKSIFYYLFCNNTYYLINRYDRHEDLFWGIKIPELYNWYKVAPFSDAIMFSFDSSPEKVWLTNNKKLPFGGHAIDKNISFWNNLIQLQ